jgi:CheY-like chemotaxis protein
MTVSKPATDLPTVLLIEDNPADVRLAKEAFKEINPNVSLAVATNAAEALGVLNGDGSDSDAPMPRLVLLDLNLPDSNGGEILDTIKSDERLRQLPVIILTTSDERQDIERMYDSYANAYVTKPDSVVEFIDMIDHLESFWLSTATLPQIRSET